MVKVYLDIKKSGTKLSEKQRMFLYNYVDKHNGPLVIVYQGKKVDLTKYKKIIAEKLNDKQINELINLILKNKLDQNQNQKHTTIVGIPIDFKNMDECDIIELFNQFNSCIDIYDPVANKNEVKKILDVNLISRKKLRKRIYHNGYGKFTENL